MKGSPRVRLAEIPWEDIKHGGDVIAAGVTTAAILHAVPDISAIATLCWVLVRLYETDTVQKLLGRRR